LKSCVSGLERRLTVRAEEARLRIERVAAVAVADEVVGRFTSM
jgi:hypothetical protein